jgi:hypothetical protein
MAEQGPKNIGDILIAIGMAIMAIGVLGQVMGW